MTMSTNILLMVFIVALFANVAVEGYKNYQDMNAKQKHQTQQDIHNASQKGIDYIKSFISEAVVTAAKDEHLNTGLAKRNRVEDVIKDALDKAHLVVPDPIINILIQSAYETTKMFIKQNHIDSRDNNTNNPSALSENDIKNKIEGSK